MTVKHHDSATFLEVWYRPARIYNQSQQRRLGLIAVVPGWFVRRTCDCHSGALASVRFDTEAEAKRCLQVLDADCRQREARRA